MYECSFKLNGKPMSAFEIGGRSFPAFSGLGKHVNDIIYACLPGAGPIPLGTYYIFDRQSGGWSGLLPNMFHKHSDWFALYAVDGEIDDVTFCDRVKRGHFRLHPKSGEGISLGCITVENRSDYQNLREILKRATPTEVPNSTLLAYGKVTVYY